MEDDVVAVRYPSVVLRLRCAPFPRVLGPTRGPRSRTRGWPQPGHGIVGTVRGLGRNRARRYRRINNTGSRSYVKRPPCYARRYCHHRWVRSTGGAGKRGRGEGGQDAVGTFYLQRRASSCNVAAVRITSSQSTWTSPPFFRFFRFVTVSFSPHFLPHVDATKEKRRDPFDSSSVFYFFVASI